MLATSYEFHIAIAATHTILPAKSPKIPTARHTGQGNRNRNPVRSAARPLERFSFEPKIVVRLSTYPVECRRKEVEDQLSGPLVALSCSPPDGRYWRVLGELSLTEARVFEKLYPSPWGNQAAAIFWPRNVDRVG